MMRSCNAVVYNAAHDQQHEDRAHQSEQPHGHREMAAGAHAAEDETHDADQ